MADNNTSTSGGMKKELTLFNFFTIGFGAIIGTGWVLLVGDWMVLGGGPIPAIDRLRHRRDFPRAHWHVLWRTYRGNPHFGRHHRVRGPHLWSQDGLPHGLDATSGERPTMPLGGHRHIHAAHRPLRRDPSTCVASFGEALHHHGCRRVPVAHHHLAGLCCAGDRPQLPRGRCCGKALQLPHQGASRRYGAGHGHLLCNRLALQRASRVLRGD